LAALETHERFCSFPLSLYTEGVIAHVMNPVLLSVLLFVLSGVITASAADRAFHLKDGDRVVFYGDSITDQRLYTTFTETMWSHDSRTWMLNSSTPVGEEIA
jgi:hypothetical protein